jgi:T4 RnlA family RNA ligase
MARACRGHTYLLADDTVKLVSNPMDKFFNLNESPLSTFDINEQFWKNCSIYEKLDGSPISTVWNPSGKLLLKSKTSFTSEQSLAATKWLQLPENVNFFNWVQNQVKQNLTVNFEWVAPDNQVVVKYHEPRLVALNVRSNIDGSYLSHDEVPSQWAVKKYDLIQSLDIHVKGLTGSEGFVCEHKVYGRFKLKSDWYCLLHKSKDSLTYMSAYEAALNGSIDDLIALFDGDVRVKARLEEILEVAYHHVNDADSRLNAFHQTYGSLGRKEYAIKAINEFQPCGLFSCAMNIYQGKDMDLNKFLIKIEESKRLEF